MQYLCIKYGTPPNNTQISDLVLKANVILISLQWGDNSKLD